MSLTTFSQVVYAATIAKTGAVARLTRICACACRIEAFKPKEVISQMMAQRYPQDKVF
jgi:hypothetical protein